MQNEQVLSKIEELKSMFTDALNSLASEVSGDTSEGDQGASQDILGGSKEAPAQLTPEEQAAQDAAQGKGNEASADTGNSPMAAFMKGNMAKRKMI